MSWRQRIDFQTVMLATMAVIALSVLIPTLLISWQAMRTSFEGGCLDKRTGEVFNYVIAYRNTNSDRTITPKWEELQVDIVNRGTEYCYIDLNTGNPIHDQITTPGASGFLEATPLNNDEVQVVRIDKNATSTYIARQGSGDENQGGYIISGPGDGRIYVNEGDTYFSWQYAPTGVPTFVITIIISTAGIAIFISIGSLLVMILPRRNW